MIDPIAWKPDGARRRVDVRNGCLPADHRGDDPLGSVGLALRAEEVDVGVVDGPWRQLAGLLERGEGAGQSANRVSELDLQLVGRRWEDPDGRAPVLGLHLDEELAVRLRVDDRRRALVVAQALGRHEPVARRCARRDLDVHRAVLRAAPLIARAAHGIALATPWAGRGAAWPGRPVIATAPGPDAIVGGAIVSAPHAIAIADGANASAGRATGTAAAPVSSAAAARGTARAAVAEARARVRVAATAAPSAIRALAIA